MSERLVQQDRVAVVTGAARGIGAAIARRLAADGAAVVALDLDHPGAADVVAGLPHGGLALRCDITDPDAVADAIAHAVERFGRIDVLVNNAGRLRNAELLTMDRATWDDVIATNLTGPFTVTRAVARVMHAAGYGRIVFVSSLAALGNRAQSNYASAKAGLGGLARTVALELGRAGITCNVVAPGFVATDMFRDGLHTKGLDADEYERTVAQASAVGRIGRPEDIAAVVAFFCAPECSFVTGQTLYATGSPAA